jgi:RND family efflux transporter MFP subunit
MDLEPLRIDRSQARAAAGIPRWVWLLVLGVSLVGLLALSGGSPPEVRTWRAALSKDAGAAAAQGVAANGYVVAARRAALSADTPGRIVEMNVTEGSVVAEGEVVARLYSDEYRAALRQAEADLKVAQAAGQRAQAQVAAVEAELEQALAAVSAAEEQRSVLESDVALARATFERTQGLIADGVVSPQELDIARAGIDGAQARLRNGQALVRAAQARATATAPRIEVARAEAQVAAAQVRGAAAARDLAEATLSKTEVRAPFAGVVVLKDAEVGEVVSPNSLGSNARGSVVTLVDFASLEVQVDLPETRLEAVAVEAPARVFLDAYPQEPYAARVARVWPTADRQKATVEVRLRLEATDARLRPDMGVRVVFLEEEPPPEGAELPALMVLPPEALVSREDQSGAFVLVEGRARFRLLTLVEGASGDLVVREGLSAGELGVLAPPPDLEDGDAVSAQEPAPSSGQE